MKSLRIKINFAFVFILCLFCFANTGVSAENGYIIKLNKKTDNIFDCYSMALMDAELEDYNAQKLIDDYCYIEDYETLEKMREKGLVESYEDNQTAYLFDYNDTLFSEQYYFDIINAEYAKENSESGKGVRVGVIDSGIYREHTDFQGTDIEDGYDYVNDTEGAEAEFYHGTFVSGIIAAASDNNEGVAGIADGVTLVPLKTFSTKTGGVNKIILAVKDAVDKYDCDIINMSFGISGASSALKAAVNYAYDNGVIMTASVGNNGSTALYYPAGYDNVIGVGSVFKNGDTFSAASYSQKNKSVFITAPGTGIIGLSYEESPGIKSPVYEKHNGTSFSAPMVSAYIAILKEIYPSLNTESAMDILKNCAVDYGDDGYDTDYGYGIMDMKRGLEYFYEKGAEYFDNLSDNPTSAPTLFPTVTPTYAPTILPTESPVPTPEYTVIPKTPAPTVKATPTATPTETPIITDKPTEMPIITPAPTVKATPTAMPAETPIITDKPTETPIITPTPTVKATPTAMPTETPIITDKPTETPIITSTPTVKATPTAIPTETPIITDKPAETPVITPTPTVTDKPIITDKPAETSEINVGIFRDNDNIEFTINSKPDYVADNTPVLIAFYDNENNMTYVEIFSIDIVYHNIIRYNKIKGKYKLMIWDGIESMRPIEYKVN